MNKSAIKWILKKTGSLIPLTVVLTAVLAAVAALSVSFSLLSRDVVDIATGAKSGDIKSAFLYLVAFIILQLVFHIAGSRINIIISGRLEMKLKGGVFRTLLGKDYLAVNKYHSGEIMNRLTSDVTAVTTGFSSILPEMISLFIRIILSVVVLFKLDKFFALIYIVAAPLFLVFARIYSGKMKSLHKKVQETEGKTRSYMTEALQNLLVVKAFRKENDFAGYSNILQKDNYKIKIKRNTISIFANIFVYVAFTFGYYFALGWGALKIHAGILSYGALTAMLQLVGQIQTPVKAVADSLPGIFAMLASAERLMEFEELKADGEQAKLTDFLKKYDDFDKIVFENVRFSYNDDQPILENFNYEINKGEFVAITGISGIGKSTLLKLLLGVIEPLEGRIYIQSKNKITEINNKTRGLFAFVPQGNMVISGSIRDNICFYNDKVSEEEIKRAAEIAQMNGFLSEMPMGLDTVIGEKGMGLSEGQIQRIAIARAILSDAPVFLLDEATSALDEKTEADFLKAIKALETKTCIIVSHKVAAKEICDKNIVVENN